MKFLFFKYSIYKFNNQKYKGTMLKIKCPPQRKINDLFVDPRYYDQLIYHQLECHSQVRSQNINPKMIMKTPDGTSKISAIIFSEYINKVGQWPPLKHPLSSDDEIDIINDNK